MENRAIVIANDKYCHYKCLWLISSSNARCKLFGTSLNAARTTNEVFQHERADECIEFTNKAKEINNDV